MGLTELPYFQQAFENRRIRKGKIFSYVGRIHSHDTLVLVADFFMKCHEVTWAIVFGICRKKMVIVIRNDGLRKNAGYLASKAFGRFGSAGGHRAMARAEIPLKNLEGHIKEYDNATLGQFVVRQVEKSVQKWYIYASHDFSGTTSRLCCCDFIAHQGIVIAVNSDANNVFITMTVKSLRPDVFVLARVFEEQSEAKLFHAGATRVVSPYLIGGRRIAQMLKRSTMVDFIDIAMMGSHSGLMMEEAKIGDSSSLIGKCLIDSHLRKDYGIIIAAIKKISGDMILNPIPSETL